MKCLDAFTHLPSTPNPFNASCAADTRAVVSLKISLMQLAGGKQRHSLLFVPDLLQQTCCITDLRHRVSQLVSHVPIQTVCSFQCDFSCEICWIMSCIVSQFCIYSLIPDTSEDLHDNPHPKLVADSTHQTFETVGPCTLYCVMASVSSSPRFLPQTC